MSKFDFVAAYAILAGQGEEPADTDEVIDVIVSESGNIAKIIFGNGHLPRFIHRDSNGKYHIYH